MISVGRILKPNYFEENNPVECHSNPNYVMLYMAKSFDVDLFLFEPKDVDFENRSINGLFFEHGDCLRKTVPIPPFIDNHYTLFDEELSNYTTVMRVYPGDTKFTTYRDLKNDGRYEDILIPTFEMNSFEDLTAQLSAFAEVILKPVLGAKGVGVIKLAKAGDKYHLMEKSGSSYLSEQELKDYYRENLSKGYILQKYIECRNKSGEPYDFRIWSVDEGNGKWAAAVYPRAGGKEGILSNIDAGGYCIPIELSLKREFGKQWQDVHKELIKFGKEFTPHYAGLIQRDIFELGIDIGITRTEDGFKYWLFEANSLPEPDVHFVGGNIAINLLIAYFRRYHDLYAKAGQH